MYWENQVLVSLSPVIMMLCNNVTTPVGGGVNVGPDTPTFVSGLRLVLESKLGDEFSSAERAMESASVGCLWWRRARACAWGEEGGWRWRREERAAVRQRPDRDTSSWFSPFTNSDVSTRGKVTHIIITSGTEVVSAQIQMSFQLTCFLPLSSWSGMLAMRQVSRCAPLHNLRRDSATDTTGRRVGSSTWTSPTRCIQCPL